MQIALVSDEYYPVHDVISDWLQQQQYHVHRFGACLTKQETCWVEATRQAAQAIVTATCQQGIFCCYSGTGTAIVANKFTGIRAALCTDVETVRLAKMWNHANVLA